MSYMQSYLKLKALVKQETNNKAGADEEIHTSVWVMACCVIPAGGLYTGCHKFSCSNPNEVLHKNSIRNRQII